MKLAEILSVLDLENTNNKPINDEITIKSCYVCDLLSQVLAGAKRDSIWITIQSHLHVIGVAVMAGISAVIVCEGHIVPDNMIQKADDEKIALFKSKESAYYLSGKLYECGIR